MLGRGLQRGFKFVPAEKMFGLVVFHQSVVLTEVLLPREPAAINFC